MITSFSLDMKNTFSVASIRSFEKCIGPLTPKIMSLILIAFAAVLFAGCSENKDGGAKKAAPVPQSNEQRVYNNREGRDSSHEGMDHNAPSMDTIHPEKIRELRMMR